MKIITLDYPLKFYLLNKCYIHSGTYVLRAVLALRNWAQDNKLTDIPFLHNIIDIDLEPDEKTLGLNRRRCKLLKPDQLAIASWDELGELIGDDGI